VADQFLVAQNCAVGAAMAIGICSAQRFLIVYLTSQRREQPFGA